MSRLANYLRNEARGILFALLFSTSLFVVESNAQETTGEGVRSERIESLLAFLENRCVDCHAGTEAEAGVDLASLEASPRTIEEVAILERSLRKIANRQMPPPDADRLEEKERAQIVSSLTQWLDDYSKANPYPGRLDAIRRLTRTEYRNAIRDLLRLEIDATQWLPADEASYGFDNITVGELSPTLMNRYVSAAQAISRMAVGGVGKAPAGRTIRIPADITQEKQLPGLPFGSRGGTAFQHQFPHSGVYEFQLRLARDRNEHVEGLKREHQLEILIDRQPVKSFVVRPPKGKDHSVVDQHLQVRLPVEAGAREVTVTFAKTSASLLETMRQPLETKYNLHRHPRQTPALYEISIVGPYESRGPGQSPSRDAVFVVYPNKESEERSCAERIVARLCRLAFRRPLTAEDVAGPMRFYSDARAEGMDFERGIERALSSILVSPKFLFRIEKEPAQASYLSGNGVYAISDLELASRLSFFLWSSIPDEELLGLAESGQLRQPEELQSQVARMLADPRSENLVDNFAAQWLYLRNLDAITPDARLFPDFDDNLRQAFRRETELLFAEVVREDLSVLRLLSSDHTYLNERLAKHYQIPHIYGSHFRRVKLDSQDEYATHRGGLLRHASIMMVTSYPTRTSPVIRGSWILKNLLGSPPPPPPENVPTLEDGTVDASLPIRERLAAHRDNEACAGCHRLIDPIGFSLENFDAIGRWRSEEAGVPIDARGGMSDGSQFNGVSGLEQALLQHPEMFVRTVVEKLMTFGIGRGTTPLDGPAIRKILRDAAPDGYRFSELVEGIVHSEPFQKRSSSRKVETAKARLNVKIGLDALSARSEPRE
jgi:mono/diheme cytochrome c family protein